MCNCAERRFVAQARPCMDASVAYLAAAACLPPHAGMWCSRSLGIRAGSATLHTQAGLGREGNVLA